MLTYILNIINAYKDKQHARHLELVKVQDAAAHATAQGAIDALREHTKLMNLWLSGLQNLSTPGERPYSSVMRDDDEIDAELSRIKTRNVDRMSPTQIHEWQQELDFSSIMDGIDN